MLSFCDRYWRIYDHLLSKRGRKCSTVCPFWGLRRTLRDRTWLCVFSAPEWTAAWKFSAMVARRRCIQLCDGSIARFRGFCSERGEIRCFSGRLAVGGWRLCQADAGWLDGREGLRGGREEGKTCFQQLIRKSCASWRTGTTRGHRQAVEYPCWLSLGSLPSPGTAGRRCV